MIGRIYKITCLLNGKIYVGQTWKTIEARFKRHCGESRWINTKKMPIVFAIKKYGTENFKIELLEEVENCSQLLLNNREIFWGLTLDSFSPKGYNLSLGGSNGILSDETKKKISIANKGKIASFETRLKSSMSHMGYVVPKHVRDEHSKRLKGKKPSEATARGARLKNSKCYLIISPLGERIEVRNMKKFCEENNLGRGDMACLSSGKKKVYKGWMCEKSWWDEDSILVGQAHVTLAGKLKTRV